VRNDTQTGDRFVIYDLQNNDRPVITIVPNIPHGPVHAQIARAAFAPDDNGIFFMAASQGAQRYDYDVYRLDLSTRQVEKLTQTKTYASDFVASRNGKYGVYFVWEFSRLNSVPISPRMELMNMSTGAVTRVNLTGLPE
jgi:Tol biopolymer transport system component